MTGQSWADALWSWADATVAFLLAAFGLYLALFPGFTVVYALVTGATLFAGAPQMAAVVVAVGGSYPFVAGDWSSRRLAVFVVALWVASGAASVAGIALLRALAVSPPDAVLARAGALSVAYPVAALAAFRDKVRRRLGFDAVAAVEESRR